MFRMAMATLFSLSVFSAVHAEDKPTAASEFKKLAGTWKPVTAELRGEKLPDDLVSEMKLEIEPEKYTVHVQGQVDKGTLSLAVDKSPKHMDVKGTDGPNQGKLFPSIYEFKDGKLRICYGTDGKNRPKEFKSEKGTKTLFIVYEKK